MKRLSVNEVNDALLGEKKTPWLHKLPLFFMRYLRETIRLCEKKRFECVLEGSVKAFTIYNDELRKILKLKRQILDIREKKILDRAWGTRKGTKGRNNNGMEKEEKNLTNAVVDLLEMWRMCQKTGVIFQLKKPLDSSLLKFDYYGYLNSNNWREIREKKIAEGGGKCQMCDETKNLDVHHETYERVGDELLSDLAVLCRKCHKAFHRINGGENE